MPKKTHPIEAYLKRPDCPVHAEPVHLVFKEKGVDVRMAVDIVSWSCDGTVTEFVLGSSDSDLQPAILEAKRRGVGCIYLGFETMPNKGISYNATRTILIRNAEVLAAAKIPSLFDGSEKKAA